MAKKTFFFYLDEKIEVESEEMTGAQIKAAIKAAVPALDLQHELVLEGAGHDADQSIADDQSINLSHGHGAGPKRFFSRPPTNFGCF